jgi:two-component system cell cycle response regulator DivK
MARVLVIEDVPINLELMTYLLQAGGHEVLQAPTGAKGLGILAETPVALVTCDIRLPGMDGYDVVRAIRARPEWAGTRVVAVTAVPTGAFEHAWPGFDGYIAKPVDPRTFVAELEEFLERGAVVGAPGPTRLWSLKPIDPRNSHWAASTYRGEVVVRAESETMARRLTASAFGIATAVPAKDGTHHVPWEYASLAHCSEIAPCAAYPRAGERGIVGPRAALAAAHASVARSIGNS